MSKPICLEKSIFGWIKFSFDLNNILETMISFEVRVISLKKIQAKEIVIAIRA